MDGWSRFTFDPAVDNGPVWSPDGSRIAYDSTRKGARNFYVKAAAGAGKEELLLESAEGKFLNDWFRNRFNSIEQASLLPVMICGWCPWREIARRGYSFRAVTGTWAQFSPDGRWVSYMSDESGRFEIYVRPFVESESGRASGGQWQVSTEGGIWSTWRPDGKEIYYIAPDGMFMAVPVQAQGESFEAGTPSVLISVPHPWWRR